MHILFYNKNIAYSEILNKEIFLLPIFLQDEKIYIYNNNYFYENWNLDYESRLIEFILPLENIEVLQTINLNKDNLLDLNLKDLFPEYKNKNLAVIIIEDTNSILEKIFIKTIIMGKNIDKNIQVKRLDNSQQNEFYQKIINEINSELISLVKSQNLIDVKTPSFLNTKFLNSKNYNLVELNKRIEKIDLIDRVFVQEFNNDYVMLKIKYLGKLDKVIQQLKEQSIILELIGDEWRIKANLMDQLVFKFPFKTKYFEQDFYVSSNNFSAYQLIESWPNWPGKWLNIFGPMGSGKTHLSKILEKKIKRVMIIDETKINNKVIQNLNSFDCLIIDAFSNKIEENLLYSILNQTKQLDSFMLINSKFPLKKFEFKLPDLRSRINSFNFIGIDLPTDDLLKVIISKSFSDKQINLNPKITEYIIKNVERSYEKMFKFLSDLDKMSLSSGKSININLIKKVLNQ